MQSLNRNYLKALVTGYGLTGLTILIQLALVPMYIKYLGLQKFGVLSIIMAANNFSAIGITWLSGSMARILAEKAATGDDKGFFQAYVFSKLIYVLYASFIVVAFWLLAPYILPRVIGDNEIRSAVILSSIYVILMYEYNADRQAFNARHIQSHANLREAAGQCVFVGCTVLVLKEKMGLPGVIGAQIVGIVLTRALAYIYWEKSTNLFKEWTIDISEFKNLWRRVTNRVGRDYVCYGIMLLALQADSIFVGWLGGAKAAATFYLLWRVPEACGLILSRIPGTFAPYLVAMDARGEGATIIRSYRNGIMATGVFTAVLAMIYAAFGPNILEYWVGNDAPSERWLYVIASGAMFCLAVSKWPTELAYSLMNTRPLLKIISVETCSKIALTIILYSSLSYASPLVAYLTVQVIGVFYLYIKLGSDTCQKLQKGNADAI